MPLDEAAAVGLVGGDVTDLEMARGVEEITLEDVQAAEHAAAEAEARATHSERNALEGGSAPQAAADREASRFAQLRAAVARRRRERWQQAERIRGLHEVGRAALAHVAALQQVKTDTLADVARIQDLQDGIRARFRQANEELIAIAARGAALDPHPLRPGGMAHPGSAHVWAAVHDSDPLARETAHVVAGGTAVSGIWADHPDGPAVAIDAAVRQISQRDLSERLVRGSNGVVVPLGRDPGGHLAKRVASGELHELDAAERAAYYAGEGA